MNTSDEIIAGLTEKISSLHSAPANSATATSDEIIALKSNLDSMTSNWEFCRSELNSLRLKIDAVRGHILDLYSMNGEIDDDMQEVARLLDIELTKRITGTMTIEVEFTADVPLGFDNYDFDLSYDISCDSIEADNFEWNEVSADWDVEDED